MFPAGGTVSSGGNSAIGDADSGCGGVSRVYDKEQIVAAWGGLAPS